MKTAGQWALMISGFAGTFLIGLAVFFLAFFPSCAPEYCVTYSPWPSQVVSVYLKTTVKEHHIREIARNRITEFFRSRAVPSLAAGLRSPQASENELWSAIGALSDLKQDARSAIPAIHVAMASGKLTRNRHTDGVFAQALANIGVTPDWHAGLSDRDPWISQVFWDAARQSASVDGFVLCWDALRADEIFNRKEAIATLKEFYFANMKADLKIQVEGRLDSGIANIPDDMREFAEWLKAWIKRETEP